MAFWQIYEIHEAAKKVAYLGKVEARDEHEAIEKAAIQFEVAADRLRTLYWGEVR
jgi:hypothetical protein